MESDEAVVILSQLTQLGQGQRLELELFCAELDYL